MRSAGRSILFLILAFVLAAVGGYVGYMFAFREHSAMPITSLFNGTPARTGAGGSPVSAGYDQPFVYAASVASPAVVHVRTRSVVERESPYKGSILEFFFGPQPPVTQSVESTGSGVIIREEGFIVTNNHVVKNARAIEVTLTNGESYRAELVAVDPPTDLALLKVQAPSPLPFIPFGNSDSLKVGMWVLAVGNPFNLQNTVTAGIVSATARRLNDDQRRLAIESFIQVDAAVNPGNSGGALVNLYGELVGINTAIASPTGTFAGYAFSVPETLVRKFVDDILTYGEVRRARMGVSVSKIPSGHEFWTQQRGGSGLLVQQVQSGSAAAEAGIENGDILTAIDGTALTEPSQLGERVGRAQPGDTLTVTRYRNGQTSILEVILHQ